MISYHHVAISTDQVIRVSTLAPGKDKPVTHRRPPDHGWCDVIDIAYDRRRSQDDPYLRMEHLLTLHAVVVPVVAEWRRKQYAAEHVNIGPI